jgi:hypothetical protein
MRLLGHAAEVLQLSVLLPQRRLHGDTAHTAE